MNFQSGFVSILGKPNAGKSTLLNALVGEKMAIVSPKVQTTRHRIKAFLNGDNFQIIFSDTPGIIEPQYKLHERMMKQVRNAMEDADAGLLVYDVGELQDEEAHAFFQQLKLKVPAILLVNKIDSVKESVWKKTVSYFTESGAYKAVIPISALKGTGIPELQKTLLQFIPQGDPFYSTEDLSDLPTRFFVGEIVREKIFDLYHQEVPYHSTVLVQEFTEKSTRR